VTEEEVEVVAEELAKAGGVSWYAGREPGPLQQVISDRYRDRARVAIAALDRFRAARKASSDEPQPQNCEKRDTDNRGARLRTDVRLGTIVIYRPPGDRRAYPCRVTRIAGGRAYLMPLSADCTYSVAVRDLDPTWLRENL
jgi:hypothetical protein